jgi:hypothetical protein
VSPVDQTLEITQHQAQWNGLKVTRYEFDYSRQAMVNFPSCEPVALHIVVQTDTVVSATCAASGQPLQGVTMTVASLFADALRAAGNHNLENIQFDSRLGFPTLVAISGPPDAGWSEQAANLHP